MTIGGGWTGQPDPAGVQTGTLAIALSDQSATWSLTGPSGYSNSGTGDVTLPGLELGLYSIVYGDDLFASVKPADDSVTLTEGGHTFTGTYTARTVRSIGVDVQKDGGAEGAGFGTWTVTASSPWAGSFSEGPTTGDATLTGPVYDGRSYSISFQAEAGYTTPTAGAIIASATPQTFVGNYVVVPSGLFLNGFFPIAQFQVYPGGGPDRQVYRWDDYVQAAVDRGINTASVIPNTSGQFTDQQWDDAMAAHGLKVIRRPVGTLATDAARPHLLAWAHPDEPDYPPIAEATVQGIIDDYAAWKAVSPNTPVYINFGGSDILEGSPYDCNGTGDQGGPYPDWYDQRFMPAADWIGNDIYPIDGWLADEAWRYDLTVVGQVLDKVYGKSFPIDPTWNTQWTTKPQFGYVEASYYHAASGGNRAPTPGEMRAMIWNLIAHGSRGIHYWVTIIDTGLEQGYPDKFEFDGMPDDLIAEATIQNATLTALAPVLQDVIDPPSLTITPSDAQIHVGWRDTPSGKYFFTINMLGTPITGTVTLTGIGGVTQATVRDEARTETILNGVISDTWAAYALHIYEIPSTVFFSDALQTQATPGNFDEWRFEDPIGNIIAEDIDYDTALGSTTRIANPIAPFDGYVLKQGANYDNAGGRRSEAAVWTLNGSNPALSAAVMAGKTIWISWQMYIPTAITLDPGATTDPWLSFLDLHVGTFNGNKWGGGWGWQFWGDSYANNGGFSVAPGNVTPTDPNRHSSAPLPIGQWFNIEIEYPVTDTTTATINTYIDAALWYTIANVKTTPVAPALTDAFEIYLKSYGENNAGGNAPAFNPKPTVFYRRNFTVADMRQTFGAP